MVIAQRTFGMRRSVEETTITRHWQLEYKLVLHLSPPSTYTRSLRGFNFIIIFNPRTKNYLGKQQDLGLFSVQFVIHLSANFCNSESVHLSSISTKNLPAHHAVLRLGVPEQDLASEPSKITGSEFSGFFYRLVLGGQ